MTQRKSVLFVCIGNACRSQMAEAFARRYGSDAVVPASAGLFPASRIPDVTQRVMRERNIETDEQFPKSMDAWMDAHFDLIVNMSGRPLPRKVACDVETWNVDDPMGGDDDTHRRVRDEIEAAVMRLILRFRAELAKQPASPEPVAAAAPAPPQPVAVLPPSPPVREPERIAPEPPRRRKFLR